MTVEADTEAAADHAVVSRRRGLIRFVLLVIAGQALFGVLAGLIWRIWSPKTFGYVITGSGGGRVTIPFENESQVAGDGRFLLLTLSIAVVAAVGAWQVRRCRGPVAVAAIAAGALAASTATWGVGTALGTGHHTGALGATIRLPLSLHAHALLSAGAFVSVLVYVALAGLSRDEELGVTPATDSTGGSAA